MSKMQNHTRGIEDRAFYASILAGSVNDDQIIKESGIFDILDSHKIKYEYQVISSDREPEKLRQYCMENQSKINVAIGIAGGVPNLPVVIKSWLPKTIVISVPLWNEIEYTLASLTTPYDIPIIVSGYGTTGLQKSANITKDIFYLIDM